MKQIFIHAADDSYTEITKVAYDRQMWNGKTNLRTKVKFYIGPTYLHIYKIFTHAHYILCICLYAYYDLQHSANPILNEQDEKERLICSDYIHSDLHFSLRN